MRKPLIGQANGWRSLLFALTIFLLPASAKAQSPVFPGPPLVGTLAQRPAACSTLLQEYFATDNTTLYYATVAGGSCTWVAVPTAAATGITSTGSPANTYLAGFTGATTISGTSAATLDSSGNVVVASLKDSGLTTGNCVQASTGGLLTTTAGACGTSSGTITATGSPASGNLSKFSGATSITNGDLSGDVTTSGTLATTVVNLRGLALPTLAASTGYLYDSAGTLSLSTSASNFTTGTLPAAQLPNPSASTLGGIESLAAVSHKWINTISTAGVPSATQPACGDLSNSAPSCSTDTTNASNITTGALPHAQLPALVSGDIPNNAANTTGNAATATALASTPTLCTTGQAPTGILASGNATGCATLLVSPLNAIGQVYGGGVSGAPAIIAAGKTSQTLTATNGAGASFASPGVPFGNGGSPVTSTPYVVGCDSGTAVLDGGRTIILQSGASVVTAPDHTATGCNNMVFGIADDGGGTITVNRSGSDTFTILDGNSKTDGATSFTLGNGQYASLNNSGTTVWLVRKNVQGGIGGVSNTLVVYSNSGVAGGITGASTSDGVNLTVTTQAALSNNGLAASTAYADGAVATATATNLVCTPGSFAAQTDGATVTWAIGNSICANASLTFTTHGGSRTLNLTGLVNGGSYQIWLKQDATGGEGLTLGTGCTWKVINGGSGAITLSSAANAVDFLAFTYDGTNCYANLGPNYN